MLPSPRRRLLAAVIAASVAIPLANAGSAGGQTAPVVGEGPEPVPTPPDAPVAPGEVIVSLEPGVDPSAVARLVGASRVEELPGRPELAVLTVPAGREKEVAQRLETSGDVRWSEPNAVVRATGDPNDPLFSYQWHLKARSAARGSANWAPTFGTGIDGRGVTVAVVDTGVTANAELDGVLQGRDFVANDAGATDENGHGTHVAGTVAQSTGNASGLAGVAHAASVLPVRVLDAQGAGTVDAVLSGLNWAVDNGAKVVNLSLGAGADSGMCEAVRLAVSRGVVVVAAAGNDGGPVSYPAACPSAIAVSAATFDGTLAPYSSRGPEVDIAAPGGDEVDRDGDGNIDGIAQYVVRGGVANPEMNIGTSMAAPHVAGALALLRQRSPASTPAQLKDFLVRSATDAGSAGVDPSFGAGLLDIAGAVARATPAAPPAALTCAPGQFVGEYWNNTTRAGAPTIRRCDAAVNFNWGPGRPAGAIGTDNFSARWVARRSFTAGSHTFTATTDDGMRVYLDGALIINAYRDQTSATTYRATRTLTAGTHEVRVEYFERSRLAVARLSVT